jgi:hypothetical protein
MASTRKIRRSGPNHAPVSDEYVMDISTNGPRHVTEHYYGIAAPQVPPKDPITEERKIDPAASPSPAPEIQPAHHGLRRLAYAIKWLVVTVAVGAVISIPMIMTRATLNVDESGNIDDVLERYFQQQYQNLVFWLFAWLLTTWIAACLFHLAALAFPYCFRIVAKFINPAHRRYWRVFHAMKWPITLLGAAIGSYIAYAFVSLHVSSPLPPGMPLLGGFGSRTRIILVDAC